MTFYKDIFLGVKTVDLMQAKSVCELLIGKPLKCTNSTFYGGDHCHVRTPDAAFELRLNHFDDGGGWRWCVKDPIYPLVLDCTFKSQTAYDEFLAKIIGNALVEMPSKLF